MTMATGRRARNIAVLAGALAALVGSLDAQPMRDQIRDIAAIIAVEAEDVADDLEDGDASLLSDAGAHAA
jgi:hypothetical protein